MTPSIGSRRSRASRRVLPTANRNDEDVESFTFGSPSTVSNLTDPTTPRTDNSSRNTRQNRRVVDVSSARRVIATEDAPRRAHMDDSTSISTMATADREVQMNRESMEEEDALEDVFHQETVGGDPDSDIDDDEDGLRDAHEEVQMERHQHLEDIIGIEPDEHDSLETGEEGCRLPVSGAPAGWKAPSPPDNWTYSKLTNVEDEPDFDDADNPGGWDHYSFKAVAIDEKVDKKKTGRKIYSHHELPTKCQVVPEENGERKIEEWTFHCDDFKVPEDESHRHGATRDDMFPETRKGCLDADLLQRIGLTKERMLQFDGAPDALFFFMLLLPIHRSTGVEGDHRKPYYPWVAQCSKIYAGQMEIGIGHGHEMRSPGIVELVRWDGSVVRDGVLGGSDGAFLRRFEKREDNTAYDALINRAFNKSRWLQVKRLYKLNINLTDKKRGEAGYDPAGKYTKMFDIMAHNINALTSRACLDQCGDETTFACMGYGPARTGLAARRKDKPGTTKGAQIAMCIDQDRIRPRAFVHGHKMHNYPHTQQGPSEVRLICEKLKPMIQGVDAAEEEEEEVDEFADLPTLIDRTFLCKKKIFTEKPHFTCDNYFSGDDVIKHAAEEEFGFTSTCRRDRLPKEIPSKCLHKEKTTPKDKRAKVARFNKPVVATKKIGNSRVVLTSFQSTSSTNFTSVNAINDVELCARKKERGRGRNKREWGIEMNQSRDLCLNSYGKIDTMDSLMKNTNIGCRSHKCWHAGMNHGKKMAIVVACDMHKECAEGNLNPDWKVKCCDFFRFREKLSSQMLQYNPINFECVGDNKLRDCSKATKENRQKRNRSRSRSPSVQGLRRSDSTSSIDTQQTGVDKELVDRLTEKGRLCGFLGPLRKHIESIKPIDNSSNRKCVVCGVDVYQECGICGAALHYAKAPQAKDSSGRKKDVLPDGISKCFYIHHDSGCVGIPKDDWPYKFKNRKDWKMVESAAALEAHYDSVKRVVDQQQGNNRVDSSDSNNSDPAPPARRQRT